MARPTKLTRTLQRQLCKHIKEGASVDVACSLVGIEHRTFYNWMRQGKSQKQGEFFSFFMP